MGDIDRRGFEALVQFLDLAAHCHPKLGIEVRERLVEQEHLRIAHDRPAHRDALSLAPGKLARVAIEQGHQRQDFSGALDLADDHGLVLTRQGQRERHVLAHCHVRIQGVVLEHHRDVTLFRRDIVDPLVADADLAGGDLL